MDIEFLENTARQIRKDILEMLAEAQSGHLGGSLGLADIFTVLYFDFLNIDAKNPLWEERDRLVLSIGHVAPALYATLARRGFFQQNCSKHCESWEVLYKDIFLHKFPV